MAASEDLKAVDVTNGVDRTGLRVHRPSNPPYHEMRARDRTNIHSTDLSGFADSTGRAYDGSGTTTFVLDKPINTSHPSLQRGPTGNGSVTNESRENTQGYRFEDRENHGTMVASVISGKFNGKRGVAPGTKLIGLTSGNYTNGSPRQEPTAVLPIILGELEKVIEYAEENPNKSVVLNISAVALSTIPVPRQMLERLEAAGVIIVVSAGNWRDVDSGAGAPGYYDNVIDDLYSRFPNVIVVGSGDENTGGRNIDKDSVFNPGIVTVVDKTFGKRNIADGSNSFVNARGTSFSAPLVAGVIQLLQERAISKYGRKFRPEEIRTLLNKTGKKYYYRGNGGAGGRRPDVNHTDGYYRLLDPRALIKAGDRMMRNNNIHVVDVQPDLPETNVNFYGPAERRPRSENDRKRQRIREPLAKGVRDRPVGKPTPPRPRPPGRSRFSTVVKDISRTNPSRRPVWDEDAPSASYISEIFSLSGLTFFRTGKETSRDAARMMLALGVFTVTGASGGVVPLARSESRFDELIDRGVIRYDAEAGTYGVDTSKLTEAEKEDVADYIDSDENLSEDAQDNAMERLGVSDNAAA
ncbi:S8/S53 family peptidase [Yoonia sp. SS1-5]|uniref:S8/S53 family peptidase n=2 Tax=Yoonia rhodophyticola TaxID=3137370 RepID=A0AAN0ME98_9RHOB